MHSEKERKKEKKRREERVWKVEIEMREGEENEWWEKEG